MNRDLNIIHNLVFGDFVKLRFMNLKFNLEGLWMKNDLVIMVRLINYKIESFNGK